MPNLQLNRNSTSQSTLGNLANSSKKSSMMHTNRKSNIGIEKEGPSPRKKKTEFTKLQRRIPSFEKASPCQQIISQVNQYIDEEKRLENMKRRQIEQYQKFINELSNMYLKDYSDEEDNGGGT